MKDISIILRSLGFLESETKTYLAALKLGPSTVIDLTRQVHLSRQAVYTAIESLSERGIMSSALVGKKRFYAAERPDKLLAYAKRREVDLEGNIQDLEKALPELELQAGGEKPVVRVFEGKEGLRAFITDVQLTKPKEVFEIADLEAIKQIMTIDDLKPVREELRKHKTLRNAIYAGEPYGQPEGPRYFLPKEKSGFKTDIVLYENRAAFITLEGKMNTFIIESPALVRTLKILFELALKTAKNTLPSK